jgi:hypothetical protein
MGQPSGKHGLPYHRERQFPLQGAGEDSECGCTVCIPRQNHTRLTKFAPVSRQNRTCLTQFAPVSHQNQACLTPIRTCLKKYRTCSAPAVCPLLRKPSTVKAHAVPTRPTDNSIVRDGHFTPSHYCGLTARIVPCSPVHLGPTAIPSISVAVP